jgi:hypothetical protein
MPVVHAQPAASGAARLVSPDIDDVAALFARCNPDVGPGDIVLASRLVAAFGAVAVQLSSADRMKLGARTTKLRDLIIKLAAEADAVDVQPLSPSAALVAPETSEIAMAAGLEKNISRRRNWARAEEDKALAKLVDWAGPVAQPIELRRQHGIERATLQHWQRSGMVVGLRVGVSKLTFPVEQFSDGRPIAGIGAVVAAIGDPHAAWLWLRQANPQVGDITPLHRLKSGAIGEVVEIAYASYG